MKNILFLLLIVVFAACSEKEEELLKPAIDSSINGVNLDFAVTLSYLNRNGEDLLNPSTLNSLSFDSMKLYYLIDGVMVEARDSNPMAYDQSALRFIKEVNPHVLMAFTYHHGDEGLVSEENGIKKGVSTAYLVLNEQDTDTIQTEWESGPNYFTNMYVSYNGQLPDIESNCFTVIKE
jgi:hypothetical protein